MDKEWQRYQEEHAEELQETEQAQEVNEPQSASGSELFRQYTESLTAEELQEAEQGKPAQDAQEVTTAEGPEELKPEDIMKARANVAEAYTALRSAMDKYGTPDFAMQRVFGGITAEIIPQPDDIGIAPEVAEASRKLNEALDIQDRVGERFGNSLQWQRIREAFPESVRGQYDIGDFVWFPGFTWNLYKKLPEVLQELKKREKKAGKVYTITELLKPHEKPDGPPLNILQDILQQLSDKNDQAAALFSAELSKTHISPNTPLSNAIRGGLIGSSYSKIGIGKRKNQTTERTIFSQLFFDFSGDTPVVKDPAEESTQDAYIVTNAAGDSFTIRGEHTAFDDAIREAIYSKIVNAKLSGRDWRALEFTPENIYQEMNHTSRRPQPAMKGAITKSLEKQNRLLADLDLTSDFERRGKTFINPETGEATSSVYFKGLHFLAIPQIIIGKGPKAHAVYKLQSYPIELSYAEQTGQIIAYKADLLDVKKIDSHGNISTVSVSMTGDRQVLRNCIMRTVFNIKYQYAKAKEDARLYETRRLADIRNGHANATSRPQKEVKDFLPVPYKDHFRILFDTLFTDAGASTDTRQYTKQARDFSMQVFDFLKARGEIADWRRVSGGRGGAIRGVDIVL